MDLNSVIIHISNPQKILPISRPSVKKVVANILSLEQQTCDEIAIHFVSVSKICLLHEQFFEDPSPTDCISFPMDSDYSLGYRVLGEVFISPQAAIDYSQTRACDPYVETTLYLVHGILHLLGYDDLDPKDRRVMRQAEKRHMKSLLSQKIYLHAPRTSVK